MDGAPIDQAEASLVFVRLLYQVPTQFLEYGPHNLFALCKRRGYVVHLFQTQVNDLAVCTSHLVLGRLSKEGHCSEKALAKPTTSGHYLVACWIVEDLLLPSM